MTPRAIALSAFGIEADADEADLVRSLTTTARLRGRLHVGWHKMLFPSGALWLTRPGDKRPFLGERGPPFPVRSICAVVSDDLTEAQFLSLREQARAALLPIIPLESALRLIPRTRDFYRLALSPPDVEYPAWHPSDIAPPPPAPSTST